MAELVIIVFTHLLNADNRQGVIFKGKDQAYESGQLDGMVSRPIAFERMISKGPQSCQLFEAGRVLDNVDALNVAARHVSAEVLHSYFMLDVTPFEPLCPECDDQARPR